jgi:ATP-dependent Clp protease adaptor protein ClpS
MPNRPSSETLNKTRKRIDPKGRLKRPSFYVVLVHDDPVTPGPFVVDVLQRFFHKPQTEASRIIALAQNFGSGVVGKFTFEIAETKAHVVNEYAREAGYPLFFSVEEE